MVRLYSLDMQEYIYALTFFCAIPRIMGTVTTGTP
jgi:hypothetical protein